MKSIPEHQHYKNPLKWGRHYIDDGDEAMTGLMSKKSARKLIRKGKFRYGVRIRKCREITGSRWAILFAKIKNIG